MSTYTFSCLIKIGGLTLDFLNEVRITSTWKEMAATALIKVPRKVLIKGKDSQLTPITQVIETGQPVVIKLGYSGNLVTEFVGYVSRSVKPGIPVEITCEDEMWKLKRTRIAQKIFDNAKLSQLVKYLLPQYTEADFDVLDTELGRDYSCLNDATGTVASALKKVEDVFGLKSFFRLVPDATQPNGVRQVLVIGKPYSSIDLQNVNPVEYRLRQNTRNDSLEYKFASDNPTQIKGILKIDNGKDIKYPYPNDMLEGSVQTRHYYGISETEFKKNIEADWLKLNVDKYEGNVTGFAIPYTRHGMVVNVTDEFYEPRSVQNLYFIDKVEVNATISGGVERINTLGYVVNDLTRATFK